MRLTIFLLSISATFFIYSCDLIPEKLPDNSNFSNAINLSPLKVDQSINPTDVPSNLSISAIKSLASDHLFIKPNKNSSENLDSETTNSEKSDNVLLENLDIKPEINFDSTQNDRIKVDFEDLTSSLSETTSTFEYTNNTDENIENVTMSNEKDQTIYSEFSDSGYNGSYDPEDSSSNKSTDNCTEQPQNNVKDQNSSNSEDYDSSLGLTEYTTDYTKDRTTPLSLESGGSTAISLQSSLGTNLITDQFESETESTFSSSDDTSNSTSDQPTIIYSEASTKPYIESSSIPPKFDSTDPTYSTEESLIHIINKMNQEVHEMRVKFNLQSYELNEERRKNSELQAEIENLNFDMQDIEEDLTNHKDIIKNLKESNEICERKVGNLTASVEFLKKLVNLERYRKILEVKLQEFGIEEELKVEGPTSVKFLIFELQTDDSSVSLVTNQQLITIPSRLADIVPYLTTLSASNCGLEFIDSFAFEKLENVKILNLSSNLLSSIENDTFEYLIQLEVLNLSFNNIDHLEALAFNGLRNLQKLNLSNNKMAVLLPGIFSQLSNLKVLILSQNLLTELKFNFFPSKISIEELYANDNVISSIDAKLIEALEGAKVIDLSNNLCIDAKYPDDVNLIKIAIDVASNCTTFKEV